MTEISAKRSESMSGLALSEASKLIRQVAGPCPYGAGSVKAARDRALHRLNEFCRHRGLRSWTLNRVRDIWTKDRRVCVRVEEAEALRALTKREKEKANADDVAELRATVAKLAKYAHVLERIDAEFFGPEISATRDHAGQARRALGTMGVRRQPVS